jgi:hypothetical protein
MAPMPYRVAIRQSCLQAIEWAISGHREKNLYRCRRREFITLCGGAAANAIGLKIADSLLLCADKVIE